MNDLSHSIQALIHPRFGPINILLGEIDCIGQNRAALPDARGIGAVFQLDALVDQELA